MAASTRGDFARLRQLVAGMGKLNNVAFRRESTALLAEEMMGHVQDGFEAGQDPWGRNWAPLKYRKGKPLIDTGLLRNSIHRRNNSAGFVVFTNVSYAGFHNYGGTFSRKARAQAREADSGRFLKQSLKSTRRREFQVQGARPATRVSFSKGYQVAVERRQFLPDANELPPKYEAGFTRVLTNQRKHYLGR